MKALLSFAVLGLALSGCASPPPAEPIPFRREVVREPETAKEPEPTAETLAPVDRWKRDLERVVPAGWVLEDPNDAIEAPTGWERTQGGRGLELTLVNKQKAIKDRSGARDPTFVFSVFPLGWEGRALTAGLAFQEDKLVHLKKPGTDRDCTRSMRFFGKNGDWLLFFTASGHDGWERPEEEVARALKISRS